MFGLLVGILIYLSLFFIFTISGWGCVAISSLGAFCTLKIELGLINKPADENFFFLDFHSIFVVRSQPDHAQGGIESRHCFRRFNRLPDSSTFSYFRRIYSICSPLIVSSVAAT